MSKNIDKNISKIFSSKYSQKLLDHGKQSTANALITSSERAIQETAEACGDLIGDKMTDKFTKVSKTPSQNNSETIKNEHNKQISKKRYISPDEKTENYWSVVNIIL